MKGVKFTYTKSSGEISEREGLLVEETGTHWKVLHSPETEDFIRWMTDKTTTEDEFDQFIEIFDASWRSYRKANISNIEELKYETT